MADFLSETRAGGEPPRTVRGVAANHANSLRVVSARKRQPVRLRRTGPLSRGRHSRERSEPVATRRIRAGSDSSRPNATQT
jgi:hypothetical protein